MTQRIPIARVDPNLDQPRKLFDPERLSELADSILAAGKLHQPITVRPMPSGRYEIVMGDRRYRAHKLLLERGLIQFAEIEANVVPMTDEERDFAAIVENLQRVDISPLEESDGFYRMLLQGKGTQEIATACGVSVLKVTWRLSLQNLAPQLKQLMESGNLEQQAANELARLPSARDQIAMFRLFQTGKISGWKAMRSAIDAKLEAKTQADIFGDSAPAVSEEDVRSVNAMESAIDRMVALANTGWKDGECRVAVKVSRDRARLMADKLKTMQSSIRTMEAQLRNAAAQADVVLTEAA